MDIRRTLDDRTVDALLSGRSVATEPQLTDLVSQLLRSVPPVPAPSAALDAVLSDGFTPCPVTPVAAAVRRRYRPALALPALLGSAAALVLAAASQNALPPPAQTAVANIVEAVTPLHVPRPTAATPLTRVTTVSTPGPSATQLVPVGPAPHVTQSTRPPATPALPGGHAPGTGTDSYSDVEGGGSNGARVGRDGANGSGDGGDGMPRTGAPNAPKDVTEGSGDSNGGPDRSDDPPSARPRPHSTPTSNTSNSPPGGNSSDRGSSGSVQDSSGITTSGSVAKSSDLAASKDN